MIQTFTYEGPAVNPEGYKLTGEIRRPKIGESYILLDDLFNGTTKPAILKATYNRHEISAICVEESHGSIADNCNKVFRNFGVTVSLDEVYKVRGDLKNLEKLIPVGYTAVRFGIPHQGEQYLTRDYCVTTANHKLSLEGNFYLSVRLILEKQ